MRHIGMPIVHLATEPVDMRKSINGLSVLVADHLECNPLSGMLFVFYNKARDKIKILYWDRNGFCLWYKRLEKHRFHIPSQVSGNSMFNEAEAVAEQDPVVEEPTEVVGVNSPKHCHAPPLCMIFLKQRNSAVSVISR